MGDGRLGPAIAKDIRFEIYKTLADAVLKTERVAKKVSRSDRRLAADIRRDAAWAYRSMRAIEPIVWQARPTEKRVRAVLSAISADLPNTVSPTPRSSGRPKKVTGVRTPVGEGPLAALLREAGVYYALYRAAASRKDKATAQDLRVAVHDTLQAMEQAVAARVDTLRKAGMPKEAQLVVADWAWVAVARRPLAKTLLRDGVQENSMAELDSAEMLPAVCPSTGVPSPSGFWATRVANRKGCPNPGLATSWDLFVSGFRAGKQTVAIRRTVLLAPAGSGAGLGMFAFNETGHLHRVMRDQHGNGPMEPMVYIDRGSDEASPAKSHVLLSAIPEISRAGEVECGPGERLIAGAVQEVLAVGRQLAVAVRMSKPESRAARRAGGSKTGTLVQMLDSGFVKRIDRHAVSVVARKVFVYGPARLETTAGMAHFCFGAWVDFADIDVPERRLMFNVSDEVVVSPRLIRYETAVIGRSPAGDRVVTAGKCTGTVVRVSVGATDQAEPIYDVRTGDIVLLSQREQDLKLRCGRATRPSAKLRRCAAVSYNVFDAETYARYRNI